MASKTKEEEALVYTISEVARKLRKAPSTVYKMARDGELPGAFYKRGWLVAKKPFDRFMESPAEFAQ